MANSDRSPLVAAAAAFDDELAVYARLGELFLKTPLGSLKHLERANQTLSELAECEQRLQLAGKRLVEAIAASRERQEQLSAAVVAHAPALQQRNTKLAEMMTAMAALATDVAAINAAVLGHNGDASRANPAEVSAAVLALSARAEQLAASARTAELDELATQAHALHQRLAAIAAKLDKAT